MTDVDCARNVQTCRLKGLIAELALNRDECRESINRDAWSEILDRATEDGDEFYDYDGPLTWA